MSYGFGVIMADLNKRTHARAIIRLLDEYARGNTGTGMPLSAAVKKRLVGDLRARHNARVYLAGLDGSFVGVAVCFMAYSTFAGAPLINVHDLIVTEAFRGRGVASALLEYIAGEAMAKKCCKITLEVRVDNIPAMRLYEKNSFRLGSHPMYMMSKDMR